MGFFSKDIKTMDDLFVHTLRDIYYAENQIVKALPEMIDKASDQELKNGFEKHLQETEMQIERLEQVFKLHGVDVAGVIARRSTAFLRKPMMSRAKSMTIRFWTLRSSPPGRQSSTTRSRAMVRLSPGQNSSAVTTVRRCSSRTFRKK